MNIWFRVYVRFGCSQKLVTSVTSSSFSEVVILSCQSARLRAKISKNKSFVVSPTRTSLISFRENPSDFSSSKVLICLTDQQYNSDNSFEDQFFQV